MFIIFKKKKRKCCFEIVCLVFVEIFVAGFKNLGSFVVGEKFVY